MTDPDLIARNIANRATEKARAAEKRDARRKAAAAAAKKAAAPTGVQPRTRPEKPALPQARLATELPLITGVVAHYRAGPLVYLSLDGKAWRMTTVEGYDRVVRTLREKETAEGQRSAYASLTQPAKPPTGVAIPDGLFP